MRAREFFTFDAWSRAAGRTIGYLRSFFDDPKMSGKGSMARLCAIVAMGAGIWTVAKTVQFAFALLHAEKGEVGTGALGILAGLATTLFATVCVGLLKRTKADGTSEPVDDTPQTRETPTVKLEAQATVQPPSGPSQ